MIEAVGAIGFAHPWLLAALALLPALIWLLRVTPPAPRLLAFPAVRLLLDLQRREESSARTPWWLLALRLLAAALVILGLARPVLNAGQGPGGTGPLLLVMDDGWASGPDWPARLAAAEEALAEADRAGREVRLLATAPSPRGEPPRLSPPMPAAEMRERIAALSPLPWPPDRAAAAAALAKSGTTSLELAVAGVPQVVAYRVNPITAAIVRRLVTVPHASLVNLLAGEEVVPERLQEQCTPERLAAALLPLLTGTDAAAAQRAAFARVLGQLRPPGGLAPSEAAAEAVLAELATVQR
ncbi:hypothetical protein FK498_04935 [Elioraea sp. Yellowstone]|uniref:BatA domain-containing protein n=1 Tax=Elioraea sp. Yellowstone TaxID=2592070 RepID=UPI00114DAE65|nr:BatA domain-containing protein [Elioraea sp. Yellowstone]TQF81633.1 hypothetical protein FK498_04935 [Elioraea sp. Yellowstone]